MHTSSHTRNSPTPHGANSDGGNAGPYSLDVDCICFNATGPSMTVALEQRVGMNADGIQYLFPDKYVCRVATMEKFFAPTEKKKN